MSRGGAPRPRKATFSQRFLGASCSRACAVRPIEQLGFVCVTVKMDEAPSTTTEAEIYFLISKFLATGPCHQTAEVIRQEIEQHQLMPKRLDWLGNEHPRSLTEVERSHSHIRPDHLVKICSRIGSILDKEIPPSIAGVKSLLGDGKQSLLRRKNDPPRQQTLESRCAQYRGAPVHPSVEHASTYPSNIGKST